MASPLHTPPKTAYHSVAGVDEDQLEHSSDSFDNIPAQYDTSYNAHAVSGGFNLHNGNDQSSRPGPGRRRSSGYRQALRNRAWWKTLIVELAVLSWLVPIVYLLYLNIHGKIIGASAWCPDDNCDANAFSTNKQTGGYQYSLGKYDKEDHNLLGGLQLVAKALEVWFVVIAGSFVYLLTMWLAHKPEGLPIGYLFRANEFSEITGLADPILWTSLRARVGKPALRPRIYWFIGFTVFLCILCNLMGPAVAVLVLPTLQWLTLPKQENWIFTRWNAGVAPGTNAGAFDAASWYGGCTDANFTDGNYSCAAFPWRNELDALVSDYWASQDMAQVITQQKAVSFQFNQTYRTTDDGQMADVVYFAPNRNLLVNFAVDAYNIMNISVGTPTENMSAPELYETYVPYNKSLQLMVERNGPILGATPTLNIDYNGTYNSYIVIQESPLRALKCYQFYNLWYTPLANGTAVETYGEGNYTKCVKYGGGWGGQNDVATFAIQPMNTSYTPGAVFDVFSSDTAAFLPNGTVPPGFDGKCLENRTVAANLDCNWTALFDNSTTPEPVLNRTTGITTIEIYMGDDDSGWTVLGIDFVAYSNFTDYTFDPYPMSNPLQLVQTASLPLVGEPILINPNWVLAGWGADRGGTVLGENSAAAKLLDVMGTFYYTQEFELRDYTDVQRWEYETLAFLMTMHTLSLVDYGTANATESAVQASTQNPLLQRWGHIYVWAYKLSSRTGYLGVAVAALGCLVVCAQFAFALISRHEYRSPAEMLVSALEHERTDAFVKAGEDEKEIARTPFRVSELQLKRRASSMLFVSPD